MDAVDQDDVCDVPGVPVIHDARIDVSRTIIVGPRVRETHRNLLSIVQPREVHELIAGGSIGRIIVF